MLSTITRHFLLCDTLSNLIQKALTVNKSPWNLLNTYTQLDLKNFYNEENLNKKSAEHIYSTRSETSTTKKI